MKKPSNPSRTTILESKVKDLEEKNKKLQESVNLLLEGAGLKRIEEDEPQSGGGVKYGEG